MRYAHAFGSRLLVLIFGFAIISSIASAEQPLVKVAADPYPPWALGEENTDAKGGIAVDIVAELFHRLGMRSRAVVYPFKRGLRQPAESFLTLP